VLGGITVSVARPALTVGGSSTVVVDLDSLGTLPSPSLEQVLRAMPLIQIRQNSRGEMQPALRGSEDRQIAVLMDGVPLTVGWDHRTDMSIIPLSAARNVTLVRGLSSVLYGPNTLGGVVDNVSVTGGHLVEDTDHEWVFRAGGGFTDRSGVPVSKEALDDASLRAQFLSEDALRLNSDQRRVDGFFSARYRNDDGAWASVAASGYDVERGVPPEAHQDAPRLWRYPEQRRMIAAVTGGTGQRLTGWGEGDLEASLGVDLGSTLIEQFATADYDIIEETEDADDRVITARMLGEHTIGSSGDVRASATFADVSHDEVLGEVGVGSQAFSYQQRLWSLGFETEWRFGRSELTTVTLGAAYDGASTPKSGDKPPLEPIADFGARVGLSSLVADGVLVHGGASRRSRFPSLRELYSGALGRFQPNPDLLPETLWGGEVRSTGIELLLVGTFGTSTLNGDLTLQSVTGFEADGTEVELEYEPAVSGKLGFDIPIPAQLRFGGEGRYVGTQMCQNPEVGGLQPLSSSTSFDLTLRRIFSFGRGGALSRLDASAAVRNVTDRAVFDQCGLPQPGRLVQVQFRIW
jgi:iron complex outermembrane receptor protein